MAPSPSSALNRAWRGVLSTTVWGDNVDEGRSRARTEAPSPAAETSDEKKDQAVAHESSRNNSDSEQSSGSSQTLEKVPQGFVKKTWSSFVDSTAFGQIYEDDTEEAKERVLNMRRKSTLEPDIIFEENQLYREDTNVTTFEQSASDGRLYRDGQLVLLPAPTSDPRDPLNLSLKRKLLAVFFLSFFGAMAAAAELILGSLLPVFALVYAHVDPKLLLPLTENTGGFPAGTDPLKTLEAIPNAQPIWKIYLLASAPVLIIGVANLAFIPTSISVGRRPVIIITGFLALAGAIWAGFSQSLGSHLAARCVQALGAGCVESLIPFCIQGQQIGPSRINPQTDREADMVHVHVRNTWISCVFAAQGVLLITLGIASPYLIINLSWRYVYFITAAIAGFFLIGVIFFMPETRYKRSRSEMDGIPRNDAHVRYPPRSVRSDMRLFSGRREWKKGWRALIASLQTFFLPHIFFITMLNSAMIGAAFAASYTVSPALLTKPWSWPFLHLGLSLVGVLIAAIFVGFLTGFLADWTANAIAKKRGKRLPENQLINLVLPTVCALIGTVLFGLSGQDEAKYPWPVFIFALGLMTFGFLGANTIGAVYVLECYPHLAG